MKKLFALLIFTTLFSCNSPDDSAPPASIDPTLLQKVVFSSGKVFNFYDSGLLKEVIQGSNMQTFIYDENDNLVSVTSTGTSSYIHTFSYDSSNFITAVDGYPVAYSYDGSGGKYTFEYTLAAEQDPYDFPYKAVVSVNTDLLLTAQKVFFTDPNTGEFSYTGAMANYENGNMYECGYSGGETGQNYEFANTVNPLRNAMLPAFRAMSLLDANFIYGSGNFSIMNLDSHISVNNTTHLAYQLEDPESSSYTYTYNSNNLPVVKTAQSYDFGVASGAPYEFAHYYYQGDVIP